jgi:hypothetical protein
MPAILVTALLIVVASVVVGRTAMLLAGWRRPEWVAGAVGLAILVVLAPFLVRLPGRGLTAAVLLGLLVIACAVVTRRAVPGGRGGDPAFALGRAPRPASHRPRVHAADAADSENGTTPRAQHLVALVVVAVVFGLSSLPFLFNERTGVLGEGIYTNDHAAQLFWADWLADGFGPEPNAVQIGYPVGPQALTAAVSEGTTFDLVDVFNGLLLAIPALTALAALSVLAGLPPWRRAVAAVLTGLPFLGASFLAQSGFKETGMALFVVAMAAVLHLATRREREEREGPPLRAVVAVLAVLAAASVFTFSIPGAVWFAVAIPVWAILWVGFGDAPLDLGALRAEAVRHRRLLIAGGVALALLAAVVIGPASGFVEKIDDVQESSGRLSSPVFPGEALGIWPEGDFRIVRGEVDGALLASGFAGLCALGAAIALVRRREWALLATLAAAVFVYVLSRPFAQIHVEAKALAVLAPVVMLVTLRWLLAPGARSPATTARLAVGGLFALLAFGSTLLALRAAPVGFDERQRDLELLAERIPPDKDVVFLGVDRFAGYYLRGTLTRSPGGYVPAEIGSRTSKNWQQGQALDFDTLEPKKLDTQEFAITTAAGYQSTPPPNWREVASEGDYVLWRRSGKGEPYEVLPEEGGDPGAVLVCTGSEPQVAEAVALNEPATGAQEDWEPGFAFEAPGSATQTLEVPDGPWAISLQYHSQVPLTITVDGEEVAELPPSLEGFYLTGAGRGAFWPAGEIGAFGVVEVEVEAAEPSDLQDLLSVERHVWLGEVALSSAEGPGAAAGRGACGKYVDHYLPAGS